MKYYHIIFTVVILVILSAVIYKFINSGKTNDNIPINSAPKNFELNAENKQNQTETVSEKLPEIAQISLEISTPKNGAVVANSKIAVTGITAPAADITINEVDTKSDQNGKFSAVITLDEGENYIWVVASDMDGNMAEKELTVTYEIRE